TANIGDDTLSIINYGDIIKLTNIDLKTLYNKEGRIGPSDLVVDDNKDLLIINSLDDSLFKINIENKKLLYYLKVGRYPLNISIFKDRVYVLNYDSRSIFIIDKKDFILLESISIGGKLTDMVIDEMNGKIYISNWEKKSISEINIDSGKLRNISLSCNPLRIIIVREYLFILSSFNSQSINHSRLLKLNLENNEIVSMIEVKGNFFDFIKIYNKDKFALIDIKSSNIFELDYKIQKIIKQRYIGGFPNKLVSDNKYIYISDLINNEIIILDVEDYNIINKIRVGKEPQGIFLL